MDDHDKQRIGEQLEPGGRPKAPGRLELLQRFINSYNHDFPREWDRIGSKDKAKAWLLEKGLVTPHDEISAAKAARLRELRRWMSFARRPAWLGSASRSTIEVGRPSKRSGAASMVPWRRSSASSMRRSSRVTGRA
jgi:hypothetical protein